jgi:hypothetical protein
MSTVLRPVGPQPPRVYWVRRGFVLLGIVIVILVIAESCSGGGSPSAGGHHPNPGGSQTPTAAQPCTTTQIKLTISADKTLYAIGESPKFKGVFTNVSAAACTLTEAPANEDWTVTSGPATIWTTKGCVTSQRTKTKTIQPGLTRTVSITWDGRQYTNCQPSSDLKNGQYLLRATLDGFTPKSGAVFDMSNSTGG